MSLTLRVGLVGFSGQKFDENLAKQYLVVAFDEIQQKHPSRKMVLVSGWTDVGIPALGYREAQRRGWTTVGIACKKAEEYERFPVDQSIVVGENWGDESEEFLKSIDIMVKIGGGKQSERECQTAKQRGIYIIRICQENPTGLPWG